MCPTGLHIDTRPKGFMEWDLYTSIIDEIAPFAEAVVLHSWGEPLLHKRIMDMIAYAKERDLWVETSTNATQLTEEVARQLLDAGLDRIYLSMDGLTKETYEKVRVKGNFEEVLGNIERFLDLKHELGSPIEADIQIVRLSETDAEVESSSTAGGGRRRPDQHQGARRVGRPDRRRERARRRRTRSRTSTRAQAVPEPLVPLPHPLGRRPGLVLARLRRGHAARERQERRRARDLARRADAEDAPLARDRQLLRRAVRGLHRVGLVDADAVRRRRHRRQDDEGGDRGRGRSGRCRNGMKPLPVIGYGSGASVHGCGDCCGGDKD